MPQDAGNQGQYHAGDQAEGEQYDEVGNESGPGVWLRKRLIRNTQGLWVRIGRLSRVHYRD